MGMRSRINPFFEPGFRPTAPAGAVREFHRSLPEYRVTPLHDCSGLAAALGLGGLFVKDESQRLGLQAFKGLGAVWALERFRRARGDPPIVAAATEGNHGRAVAWAARRLGLQAVIFLPSHAAPARVEHIRTEGARVELVDGSYDDTVARCAELSAQHGWQVISDTGYEGYLEIPQWIADGYSTLFAEAAEQLAQAEHAAPDVAFIQAGVGGLLHAATTHFRSASPETILVAVEPVAADALLSSISSATGSPLPSAGRQDSIMAGLNCGEVSRTAWPTVRRGVSLFLTVEDRFAEEAMRRLGQPVGDDPRIEAGETGGAGLAGLLAVLHAPELQSAREFLGLGRRTRVLAVNTEGATDPEGYGRIVRQPSVSSGQR